MNAREANAFLDLLETNRKLVDLALQLLGRTRGAADVDLPADLSAGRYAVFNRDDRVLLGELGLAADCGQPTSDDPSGAHADRDAELCRAGDPGVPEPGRIEAVSGDRGGLREPRGRGNDPQPADYRGSAVPDGGTVPFSEGGNDVRPAVAAEPGPFAGPNSGCETRHCRRCKRDLPITAFRVRTHVCDECRTPKLDAQGEARRQSRAAYGSRTELSRDPGYTNGLSSRLAGRETGAGTCRSCGKDAAHLYAVDETGGGSLCYPCLQARERETVRRCVVCDAPIPADMSKNATICGPVCRKELSRRNSASQYARRREGGATARGEIRQ